MLQLILAGYSVSWTGFGERTLSNGDFVGEKTLWDWMELLIIPFVLAIGAFFLNRSERALEGKTAEDRAKLERELAIDRQQEVALQTYIDRMSELLPEKDLRATENFETRNIARTRTLSVLRRMDGIRKGQVISFLREANLIEKSDRIIDLAEANLNNVDLSRANLEGVDLQWTHMQHANFVYAYVINANLSNIDLTNSNLSSAQFSGTIFKNSILTRASLCAANLCNTDLYSANLEGTNLLGAELKDANLNGANLKDAKVTPEQLGQAKSLKSATMPDGTIYE